MIRFIKKSVNTESPQGTKCLGLDRLWKPSPSSDRLTEVPDALWSVDLSRTVETPGWLVGRVSHLHLLTGSGRGHGHSIEL